MGMVLPSVDGALDTGTFVSAGLIFDTGGDCGADPGSHGTTSLVSYYQMYSVKQ